ncbi:MAG: hypothetical protein CMO55_27550 [Verrucomicrobiales bacterium]|nr:hypothetical protein [Verrucomicrobiales bacterium]
MPREYPEVPFSASPVERRLRSAEEENPTDSPSMLLELLEWLEEGGRWYAGYSDLAGLAEILPDFALPVVYQLHRCDFCAFAKRDVIGLSDCVKNKHAVNRLVISRQEGLEGQCHLGITDLAEPLLLNGDVVGIFYLGSIIDAENEEASKDRLLRYCNRRKLDASVFLEQWRKLPRIDTREIEKMRSRLQLVARIATRLAAPAESVPDLVSKNSTLAGVIWQKRRNRTPTTLQKAMEYVNGQYRESLRLNDVADHLGIRPDSLGSLFRKYTDGTMADYLASVRIRHACELLKSGRFSGGEIALLVGFTDQSQFSKTFKKETGLTPTAYTRRMMA